MVTIGMNYHVLEGKNEPFEKMFKKVMDSLQNAEGHSHSKLYRNTEDQCSYLIVSEWSDEDSFKSFISSAAFHKVTSWGSTNILKERPQHKVYRI